MTKCEYKKQAIQEQIIMSNNNPPYNMDAVRRYWDIGCYACDTLYMNDCEFFIEDKEEQIKGCTLEGTIKTLLDGE